LSFTENVPPPVIRVLDEDLNKEAIVSEAHRPNKKFLLCRWCGGDEERNVRDLPTTSPKTADIT
jgi:hypothetical protein